MHAPQLSSVPGAAALFVVQAMACPSTQRLRTGCCSC